MEERTEPINLWKKMFSVFFLIILNFIYLLAVQSSLLHRLFSSCGTQASHCCGFSCCRAQTVRAQRISSFSSSALEQRLSSCGARHVRSSWIRDWTHISCTGRGILYHSATKEVLSCIFDALEFELCSPWRDYHLKDRDSKGPPCKPAFGIETNQAELTPKPSLVSNSHPPNQYSPFPKSSQVLDNWGPPCSPELAAVIKTIQFRPGQHEMPGKPDNHMHKNELGSYPTPLTKIDLVILKNF